MDILDFFWTFYLNHLSPIWGYFFLSDPPPAEAVLFTDKSTIEKIEKVLTDKKYTTPLKLVVEECDKEKLKAQEEVRKEWAHPDTPLLHIHTHTPWLDFVKKNTCTCT